MNAIFVMGLTMGLAYLAPIGMQNLFVINSALNDSRKRALLTGLIVAAFDISLSMCCFYGIGTLMEQYGFLKLGILFFGSIIVIKIGIGLVKSKVTELNKSKESVPILKTISSACVVTWCNPQAILDGTVMLGAFHVTLMSSQTLSFMSGIVMASLLWFLGLILLISSVSSWFNPKVLTVVNRVCGMVIVLYGMNLMWSFFKVWQ